LSIAQISMSTKIFLSLASLMPANCKREKEHELTTLSHIHKEG
jgi:hypothetical protein